MRIAMTGATGLLGRNLLFEIIKQNIDNLDDLEILVLGRPQKSAPLDQRLDSIIKEDGYYYIGIEKLTEDLKKKIDQIIQPIASDLTEDNLGISSDDLNLLKAKPIDHFFHVAALTDFRSDKTVEQKLDEVNVNGTKRIIKLLDQLDIKQAIYIGSAYSSGSKAGSVAPDYINLDEKFRNPYEKSKLKAETAFREHCKKKGLKSKVFRPSTICGRLLEKPIGSANKFDVFYAWAAFFIRQKMKMLGKMDALYEKTYEYNLRIQVNLNSGLNIVPVDYAAKLIYWISVKSDSMIVSYHVANPQECLHKEYIKWMLNAIGITGTSFVDTEPKGKTDIEKLYYRTVGKIFTPYILSAPIHFDVGNIQPIEAAIGVKCPLIDKENFNKLMKYAKQNKFGIKT